jgi:hypothetical protein
MTSYVYSLLYDTRVQWDIHQHQKEYLALAIKTLSKEKILIAELG